MQSTLYYYLMKMTKKMTPEEALQTIASLKKTNKKLKEKNEESFKNSFIVYACVVVFLWIMVGFGVAKRTAMGRGLGLAIKFLKEKYGD